MILLPAILAFTLPAAPPQHAEGPAARGAASAAGQSLVDAGVVSRSDDEPRVCVRNGNTLQMNACVVEELAREEARMQRYFDLGMERATGMDADSASGGYGEPTRQVELMVAAQDAWATYADLRCQGEWDKVKDGTIRTIVFVGCKIDATRQRTHDIWADHLTYWDSTPPMLPEPVLTVFGEQQDAAQTP